MKMNYIHFFINWYNLYFVYYIYWEDFSGVTTLYILRILRKYNYRDWFRIGKVDILIWYCKSKDSIHKIFVAFFCKIVIVLVFTMWCCLIDFSKHMTLHHFKDFESYDLRNWSANQNMKIHFFILQSESVWTFNW